MVQVPWKYVIPVGSYSRCLPRQLSVDEVNLRCACAGGLTGNDGRIFLRAHMRVVISRWSHERKILAPPINYHAHAHTQKIREYEYEYESSRV